MEETRRGDAPLNLFDVVGGKHAGLAVAIASAPTVVDGFDVGDDVAGVKGQLVVILRLIIVKGARLSAASALGRRRGGLSLLLSEIFLTLLLTELLFSLLALALLFFPPAKQASMPTKMLYENGNNYRYLVALVLTLTATS